MRHFVLFPTLILTLMIMMTSFASAQDQVIRAPETLEGAEEGVLDIGDKLAQGLPNALGRLWSEQVFPIWQTMWEWTKREVWQQRVQPALQKLLEKGHVIIEPEIEKRKEFAKERLEQQKEEFGEDIAAQADQVKQSLWERFLSLFEKD